jgi:hypothetical protein
MTDFKQQIKETSISAIESGIKFGVTVATALTLTALMLQFITPTPTAQDIDRAVQEKLEQRIAEYEEQKFCKEWDYDYVYAYNKNAWQRMEKIPETGVIGKEDFRDTGGGIWLTLNRSEVNVSAPDKVVYHSVKTCVEHGTRMVKQE